MSPAVSWFIWSIALPATCFGAVVLFTYEQPEVPSTSFTQLNTAVLATVKKGDLILCTDPETNQVRQALLIQSIIWDSRGVTIYGNFLDKDVFRETGGLYPSYFDKCQVEAFRDDGLSSIDQKIGKIIRSGLNPPLPSQ